MNENNTTTLLDAIRRTRFEAEITAIMSKRHPRQHALMQHFARRSDAFVKLRAQVIDHYFFEQSHLSPLFCVDAVVRLIDRMVETMQGGLRKQAA